MALCRIEYLFVFHNETIEEKAQLICRIFRSEKHNMNAENLKAFIKYGVDEAKTHEKIQLGGIGVCLFAAFGCLPAVFDLKNLFSMICAIVIALLTVPYFVFIVKIPKDLTIKNRVVCDAVNSLYIILTSTLGGAAWISVSQALVLLPISFAPIIAGTISALNCWIKLKRNKYISKKNDPNLVNIVVFSALGVFVGKRFYDYYSSIDAGMTSDVLVLAIGLIAIAILFAIMGTPSFLKIHYLKVLKQRNIDF